MGSRILSIAGVFNLLRKYSVLTPDGKVCSCDLYIEAKHDEAFSDQPIDTAILVRVTPGESIVCRIYLVV